MTERDNVYPIFPGVEIPQPTISDREAQENLTHELSEILVDASGYVAVLGGIIRRMDLENTLGQEISEEEFELLMAMLSGYTMNFMVPLIPVLVRDAHEQFHTHN